MPVKCDRCDVVMKCVRARRNMYGEGETGYEHLCGKCGRRKIAGVK